MLASFIAHTVQDEKAATSLLKAAERLSLADDPDADTDNPFADTSGDRDTRTLEEIMEHGNTAEAFRRNSLRKGPGLPFM